MGPSGLEGVTRSETPHESREAVRVWLLGGFRVSVGSRTIEQHRWRLRKVAALVKLLSLAPGHHLHREQAMDLLLPDLEKKAASFCSVLGRTRTCGLLIRSETPLRRS